MKIFILFFSLFLPLIGIQAQTIRDINTKDVPKYKIKFRPISIDPKLGTIRNPNEYLEDIELDTIVKSIASIVSNSSDLGKPINYATQAALLLKADKSQVNNVDNTRDINKPISIATQAALNLLTASNSTSLTGITDATNAKLLLKADKTYTDNSLNLKFDKAGGAVTGDIAVTGNVGIGTYTPTSALHVKGNRIAIESESPTIFLKNTVNGNGINALEFSANNDVKIANGGMIIQSGGGSATVYVQNNNGNVGIGTTTPSEKLEVNGSAKFGSAVITGDVAMGGNINYAGGAKITVSPDGKSFSIKPGGTAGTPIAKPPVELYVTPIAIQEDSVKGYLYKGRQLFKQTFNYTDVTSSTIILSNIQDVYQLQGSITYTTANGNVVTYNLQNMITTGLALLKYLITPGTLTINPYDCGNCTNQNFNVTAKYTKRP